MCRLQLVNMLIIFVSLFLILLFNFRLRILVFKTPDWCVICDKVYKNNKINRLWLI